MIGRRGFLKQGLALGCSAAASPFMTPIAFASAPWNTRLVVIVLRGAMDGLHMVQPYGDPAFVEYRPNLAMSPDQGAFDLDGFFAMHGDLAPLWPLWQAGELGFVHAVSTPYRDKRSHFDGQDILEAGGYQVGDVDGGWLNRLVSRLPASDPEIAYAVGREQMLILSGQADVSSWSPDATLSLSPQAQRLLQRVYEGDPLFEQASLDAINIAQGLTASEDMTDDDTMMGGSNGGHVEIAKFAASRLAGDARIASFSLNGWDTHVKQNRNLRKSFANLSDVILTLRAYLGPVWQNTAVIAMTEFGRTVAENGNEGTDHGTGGAMLTAGGAIRGGRVVTNWPGLAEADLYARRDLMPTQDVRAIAGWIMRGATDVPLDVIRDAVFPGVDMGTDPKFFS